MNSSSVFKGGNGWTITNGGREIIPEKDNSVEKRVPKERSPAMINMKQVVRTWTGVRLDFPKSAVRGSWKRRTFVTRKRAKFTGAFLLRWHQWMLIIILY